MLVINKKSNKKMKALEAISLLLATVKMTENAKHDFAFDVITPDKSFSWRAASPVRCAV